MEKHEELMKTVRVNVACTQERQSKYHNCHSRDCSYQLTNLVWVRAFTQSCAKQAHMAKLAPKWKGPANILAILNRVNYNVFIIWVFKSARAILYSRGKPETILQCYCC